MVALLASGCFVFEELDKGQELMEQHGGGGAGSEAPEAESGAGSAESGEPGLAGRVWAGVKRAPGAVRELASGLAEGLGGGSDSRGDPEGMVRCALGDRVVFTRRADCEARGGRAVAEAGRRRPGA